MSKLDLIPSKTKIEVYFFRHTAITEFFVLKTSLGRNTQIRFVFVIV